jgi:hypothetical protein
MTFTDVFVAIFIMILFLSGFSKVAFPVISAWNRISNEYQDIRSIEFVASSFKKECASKDRNIEKWKKIVAVVNELESCEIIEYVQGDTLRALKAICVISGESIEIIGLCAP